MNKKKKTGDVLTADWLARRDAESSAKMSPLKLNT